jgi:ubiquinone/menaquinone biosynthesis C-methylase UbiE
VRYAEVLALDISPSALRLYRRFNPRVREVLHGSAFAIPLPDASVDGVYNLGVMEHFVEEEILKMLGEFRRVLRPDGTVVLFWPPTFGASVVFLRGVHGVLNLFSSRPVKLHPDEVSLVQSRRQLEALVRRAGFAMKDYGFGPRDAFTYVTVALVPEAPAPETTKDVHVH